MTERLLRQFIHDRRPQNNTAELCFTWWVGDPEQFDPVEDRGEELPEKVFDLLSKGKWFLDVGKDYQTEREAWLDLLDTLRQL